MAIISNIQYFHKCDSDTKVDHELMTSLIANTQEGNLKEERSDGLISEVGEDVGEDINERLMEITDEDITALSSSQFSWREMFHR